MSTQIKPVRRPNGQLLPGHTANPHGRPRGSMNSKTKLAARLAAADAAKWYRNAARVAEAEDTDPQLRAWLSIKLYELAQKAPEDSAIPGDEYRTEKEERLVSKIIGRWRARQQRGQVVRTREQIEGTSPSPHPEQQFTGIPASAQVLDVQPLVIPLTPKEDA